MPVRGGFKVGEDGRCHTSFTHNPSSLRLSSVGPNLQNIPSGRGKYEFSKWVRECFVAPDGYTFWARDYSGIEAVLVGYFCHSPGYIRLAGLGVHAFLCSHILERPADLAWSDADLRDYFASIKRDHKDHYAVAKRIVHGSNYMMTPRKMLLEYPDEFEDTAHATKLQDLYFDLFPEIREWHRDICQRVDGTKRRTLGDGEDADPWTLGVCHARNPFGYVHHFYNVVDWKKVDGQWNWSFGNDAKRLVSFLPQSTASAILKQAGKAIWREDPTVAATMRLFIHDEILGECREDEVERCLEVSREIMERPVPELPIPEDWGMGPYLSVGTEAKVGSSWGGMG